MKQSVPQAQDVLKGAANVNYKSTRLENCQKATKNGHYMTVCKQLKGFCLQKG